MTLCVSGDPCGVLKGIRCPQGIPGASQCLFGDPEEIRRLNAHKVSQVTNYLSGDPCGVPKATMPTRSPMQVHPSVCMCMCSVLYMCILTCGHSLFLTEILH